MTAQARRDETAEVITSRLRPAISKDNAFFWAGVRRRELLVQQCRRCDRLQHPPAPCCIHCQSFDVEPAPVSGRGVIHSYVRNQYPTPPGFNDEALAVLVQLDEGVRIVASYIGDDEPVIGRRVLVDFVDQPGDWTVPAFRPE